MPLRRTLKDWHASGVQRTIDNQSTNANGSQLYIWKYLPTGGSRACSEGLPPTWQSQYVQPGRWEALEAGYQCGVAAGSAKSASFSRVDLPVRGRLPALTRLAPPAVA